MSDYFVRVRNLSADLNGLQRLDHEYFHMTLSDLAHDQRVVHLKDLILLDPQE